MPRFLIKSGITPSSLVTLASNKTQRHFEGHSGLFYYKAAKFTGP